MTSHTKAVKESYHGSKLAMIKPVILAIRPENYHATTFIGGLLVFIHTTLSKIVRPFQKT